MRTSRTILLLKESELSYLKNMIHSKAKTMNPVKLSVYQDKILKDNEGEINQKKGNINAYVWGIITKKGNSISMNLTVVNGFEDYLFNDEEKIKIYYEIFPSASGKQANHTIFDKFDKIQTTETAKNMTETKKTINIAFSKLASRVRKW